MQTTYIRKFEAFPFIISLLITLGIGVVASVFTRPEIAGWYTTLTKPSFTPPNWLFPVAWTAIYLLIGTSAYLVWKRRDKSATYKTSVAIYIVQLLLNFSWSIIFFGFHQVLAALIVIVLLLVCIILNINWFGRCTKTAAWLLVPYMFWVCFAMLLNLSIYIINK